MDESSTLTPTEKKLIIGEATGLSIGLVLGIMAGVYFVSSLSTRIDSNTEKIEKIDKDFSTFKSTYISHTRLVDDNFQEIDKNIGRLEGKVDVILHHLKSTSQNNR